MSFGSVNIGGTAIKSIATAEIDQITAGGTASTEGTYLDGNGVQQLWGKVSGAIDTAIGAAIEEAY